MTSIPVEFGYPRALYDPNYVPPQLLHRTRELHSLTKIFQSSLKPNDEFNLNVYIYGIRGVGKTVFTKFLIEQLKTEIDKNFVTLYLDFAVKSPSENLRLLVENYSQAISKKFTYFTNSKELWSYFQFLRNKSDIPMVLILDNIDLYNQKLYNKIIRFSKSLKLSTIATSPIPFMNLKSTSKGISHQLDFPFELDTYSPAALLDITSQRIALAFPTVLETPLTKYIVDLVTQFDLYRPSTCINILKTIYRHIIVGDDIDTSLILDISTPLVEFPHYDDLDCILEFDDSPIELFYLPLIEKLAIHFKTKETIYITRSDLYRLYQLTCDELTQPYNENQFHQFTDQLIFNGFLYSSQFKSVNGDPLFFMIINPNRILEYIEIKYSEDFLKKI